MSKKYVYILSLSIIILAMFETIYVIPLLNNNQLSLASRVNGWFPNWPTKGNEVWIDLLMNMFLVIGIPIENHSMFKRVTINLGIGNNKQENERLLYVIVLTLVLLSMVKTVYFISTGNFILAP